MAELAAPTPRWWVRGDLDGFLGLGLDNLIQILLIVALCRGVLGYPDGLIFGTILPATGISLVVATGVFSRRSIGTYGLPCSWGSPRYPSTTSLQ